MFFRPIFTGALPFVLPTRSIEVQWILRYKIYKLIIIIIINRDLTSVSSSKDDVRDVPSNTYHYKPVNPKRFEKIYAEEK